MITTAFQLAGFRIVQNLGIVRGITVRSRNVFGTIGGSLQTLVGGDITLFTELCEKARGNAFELMSKHAAEMGANSFNKVLIFDELMDSSSLFLTGNTDTVYVMGAFDLKKDGAIVVEIPPDCGPGTVDAFWRNPRNPVPRLRCAVHLRCTLVLQDLAASEASGVLVPRGVARLHRGGRCRALRRGLGDRHLTSGPHDYPWGG